MWDIFDLKDFMRQAGEVTYADAHKQRRNEGVVEFATNGDMRNALVKLDGKELHGRRIHLIDDSRGRRRRSRSHSYSRSRSRTRSRRIACRGHVQGLIEAGRVAGQSLEDERIEVLLCQNQGHVQDLDPDRYPGLVQRVNQGQNRNLNRGRGQGRGQDHVPDRDQSQGHIQNRHWKKNQNHGPEVRFSEKMCC
ncbi:Serine/arginine-rich splicing factor 4 [Armadillidium vulgare]|nr:Serine/arginine-rich splicing factor 4 [Armadillidium vulgare]